MLRFRKDKQKVNKEKNVVVSRPKTDLERKREIIDIRLRKEFERLSKSGISPIEIARKMSQLRCEYEDELFLTIEELKDKRSKRAKEMLDAMSEYELYELFTEYFVNSRLVAAKEAGKNDLEIEDMRLSSEAYVAKLLSMSNEERIAEFSRLDEEKMQAAKKSNDENIFKYCLNKELEALRKKGYSEDALKAVTSKRTVEFITGASYSKKELDTARLELEYRDLTTGTSYIVDSTNMSSVLQSLYMVKSELELRKLVAKRTKN